MRLMMSHKQRLQSSANVLHSWNGYLTIYRIWQLLPSAPWFLFAWGWLLISTQILLSGTWLLCNSLTPVGPVG